MRFPYLEYYSVFKASAAEILGLEIENGKIPVSIGAREFEAKIGFSRGLGIGFHIMGRMDIFSNFRICFDETGKAVEFMPK